MRLEGLDAVRLATRLSFLLLFAVLPVHFAARHNAAEMSCQFPERWAGSWFQSGVRSPITIQGSKFSTKGRCLSSDGDKFLIVDEKGSCFRCVVIHEKHENVLQYKETYCSRPDTLYSLCSHITGDALLYSMFRQNAVPLSCPFSGYHIFSYNRGHGECKTPASIMESCTQDSKLILRYQACPDVYGSEAAVEELQCLATWKEGSSRYLVGKMSHGHTTSNEDRYRCFVYEKGSAMGMESDPDVVYRVAQSGDATCNGLFSALEGSRTLTLHRGISPSKCKFPGWMTTSSRWHSLDYTTSYAFHHRNSTIRVVDAVGGDESRIQCTEIKSNSGDTAHILGHYTVGCQSGYVCMMFYKRDAHVIELQAGTYTRRQEEACSSTYFDRNKLPYTTLVTNKPEVQPCPQVGRFSVAGVSRPKRSTSSLSDQPQSCSLDFRSLSIGCSQPDIMEFRSTCPHPANNIVSAYTCHASWTENGTSYLITTPVSRSSHGARRYCFAFTPGQTSTAGVTVRDGLSPNSGTRSVPGSRESGTEIGAVFHYSSSGQTCNRTIHPGVSGVLAFNITATGSCIESSSSHPNLYNHIKFLPFFIIFYSILIFR